MKLNVKSKLQNNNKNNIEKLPLIQPKSQLSSAILGGPSPYNKNTLRTHDKKLNTERKNTRKKPKTHKKQQRQW